MKKFIFMVIKYKWLKIVSPSLGRLHEKPYSYFWEMATSPSKTGVEVGKGAKEAFKKGLSPTYSVR